MADFKTLIKNHLESMAGQDPAFAEKYNNKEKSLDGCVKYIISQAQKQKTGNCAAIEDDVVYGWAVHYYQEDKIKSEPVKGSVKVVTPKTEEKKAEVKVLKPASKKSKKEDSKCVQLDLFGEF